MDFVSAPSIILLTALYANVPCKTAFQALTLDAIDARRSSQKMDYVNALAELACQTNNPDVIWKIAHVETGFEFEVVRFNKEAKVIQGDEAVKYLNKLRHNPVPINIDIGVMQVNWYFHNQHFDGDPLKMLQPENQARFLVEKMGPQITKRCRQRWIGCYHNPANGARAKKYNRAVKQTRRYLEKLAAKYLDEMLRPKLARRSLPQQHVLQFYKVSRSENHGSLRYHNNLPHKMAYQRHRRYKRTQKTPQVNHLLYQRIVDLTTGEEPNPYESIEL